MVFIWPCSGGCYQTTGSLPQWRLVPRLSSVAEEEFVALSTLMADVTLVDAADVHRCPWEDAAGKLSSSAMYNIVVSTGAVCEYYKFVWENCAPPKVKFFGWLLIQDRIQTKKNLLKKHCLDNDTCEVCGPGVESIAHLIVGCAFSAGFWHHLNIDLSEDEVANLWTIQPPAHLLAAHYNAFLLLCCWRPLKAPTRCGVPLPPPCYDRLFLGCREDAELWACRMPRSDRSVALAWADLFTLPPSTATIVTDM
jgi:hypothetical protein